MLLNKFSLLFSDRFELKIIPVLDFDQHFDFLCEKIRLSHNSKIKPEHFRCIFYALLYVRIFPKSEIGSNIAAMLSYLYIPNGFQKCISFIPLRGQFYTIKGTSLTLSLHNEVIDYVEMNYKNRNLLSNLNYLSRELGVNKTVLAEKFDEKIMFGTNQGFLLNSFMNYNLIVPKLGTVPEKLYVSNASPDINVSVAVSLLFGLHCEEKSTSSFIGLAGCIGLVEFDIQSFLHNVRVSIDLLIKNDRNGKNSDNKDSFTKWVNPGRSGSDTSAASAGSPPSGNTYVDDNVQMSKIINERLVKLEGSFSRLEDIIRKDVSLRNLSFYPEVT